MAKMAKMKTNNKPEALTEIENQYQQLAAQTRANSNQAYNQYREEQQRLADLQRQQAARTRNAAQNQNYVAYMMNQKNLPGQLARLGITGGAAESSQLRANMNYENARNATNNEYSQAEGNINNALTANLNNYKMTADEALRNNLLQNEKDRMAAIEAKKKELRDLKKEKEQEKERKRDKARSEYAETIRRFNTIKKVNSAIARAKKNGAPQWKIQLLQVQRADLIAAGEKSGSGSGSGRSGGGRNYGRSRYGRSYGSGSGSGSGKTKKKKPEVAANKAARTATSLVRNVLKNLY